MSPARLLWFAGSLLVGAALVLGWQWIADLRLISPIFLPGPDRAWQALVGGLKSGELEPKIFGTVGRMLLGWLLASLIGVALGAMIGISPRIRAYLNATLEMLRPLPASAIIPVAIALLGLSEGMVLTVIAFGALWPMLLATVHGFAAVEPRLYEVSRVLGLSKWQVIRKIALPSALPDILSGMRLGISLALILAVVGEMLTSRDGLGQWILLAARSFRASELFAGVLLLGLIGFVSAQLLSLLESRLLRWRARS
jgi:ABC-type nitrate/sulfonate/bicarbonate transport system permease component